MVTITVQKLLGFFLAANWGLGFYCKCVGLNPEVGGKLICVDLKSLYLSFLTELITEQPHN